MNRTTVMIFSFITGAMVADATHPAGAFLYWGLQPAEASHTDTDVGCTDDCLEPEQMPPARSTMECIPSKDQTYLKCWVRSEKEEPTISWEEWLKGQKT